MDVPRDKRGYIIITDRDYTFPSPRPLRYRGPRPDYELYTIRKTFINKFLFTYLFTHQNHTISENYRLI